MINIKDIINLVKFAMNFIFIIITNYYQIIVSKTLYLMKTNKNIIFFIRGYSVNSLNT